MKKKGRAPQYVMLGRVVKHHSPAYLSNELAEQYVRDHEAMAKAAEAALRPKDKSEDAKKSAQIGMAARKMFASSPKAGTDTQSPGYQAYRAGERSAY